MYSIIHIFCGNGAAQKRERERGGGGIAEDQKKREILKTWRGSCSLKQKGLFNSGSLEL